MIFKQNLFNKAMSLLICMSCISSLAMDKRDESGSRALISAIHDGDNDKCFTLIKDQGVNANSVHEDGRSALYRAVLSNNESVVHLLLENGANPNLKTKSGFSPLHAAWGYNVAKMLLDKGAEINPRSKDDEYGKGWTPAHSFYRNGKTELLELLRIYATLREPAAVGEIVRILDLARHNDKIKKSIEEARSQGRKEDANRLSDQYRSPWW